ELPEPALDLHQFLVPRHRIKDAQILFTRRYHIFALDLLLATQPGLALEVLEDSPVELPIEVTIAMIFPHDSCDGGTDLLRPLQVARGHTPLELLQLPAGSIHRLLTLRLFMDAAFVGVDDDDAQGGVPGVDFLGPRAGRIGLSFAGVDAPRAVDPLRFVE